MRRRILAQAGAISAVATQIMRGDLSQRLPVREADDGGFLQPAFGNVDLDFAEKRVDPEKNEGLNPGEHGGSVAEPCHPWQKGTSIQMKTQAIAFETPFPL